MANIHSPESVTRASSDLLSLRATKNLKPALGSGLAGFRRSMKKKKNGQDKGDARAFASCETEAEYNARVIARLDKASAAVSLAEVVKERILKKEERMWGKRTDAVASDDNYVDVMTLIMKEAGPDYAAAFPLFDKFSAGSWEGDFDTAREILPQLKEKIAAFRSLPPFSGERSVSTVHEQTLARRAYEEAVVLSVRIQDQDAFARDFSLLRPFYTESRYRHRSSSLEYDILRFNLLRLLLLKGLADFHTELESLSAAAEQNPCCIKKIYKYKGLFKMSQVVNFLLSPIDRDKISGWRMMAHGSSSIADGQKMLLSLSELKLLEYIKEYHPEWEMKDGSVVSERAEEMSKHCTTKMKLINEVLGYIMDLYEPKALGRIKVI